jgi:hypothetical protein
MLRYSGAWVQVFVWEPDGLHSVIQAAQQHPGLCAAYALVTAAACVTLILSLHQGAQSVATWVLLAVVRSITLTGGLSPARTDLQAHTSSVLTCLCWWLG